MFSFAHESDLSFERRAATVTVNVNIPKDAAIGTYNITVNTQDITGNPSHSATITVTIAPDFLLTSSTSSQTVTAGQTSGPYNLRIQPVGTSFNSPITIACSAGLPAQASCNFSPDGPITPGSTAVDIVMSISTKASAAKSSVRLFPAISLLGFFLPAIVIMSPEARRRIGVRTFMTILGLFLLLGALPSCGGISAGGGGTGITPGNPVTYHVRVTGTASGTPPDAGQSTTVTLVVN